VRDFAAAVLAGRYSRPVPQDVIVGFDGSSPAEDALGLERRLAASIGGRLVGANAPSAAWKRG
jgi:hypothetical protein